MKYSGWLHPKTKGGNNNPLFNIAPGGQEEALKEKTEYELRQNGIYLQKIRPNMD